MPDTENKILMAAEREFLAKGFAGARTTAIAEAAGVTHAMLHYYYRTKEKLFQKVLEGKMELIRDMMLGSIDNPDLPLFEKLEQAIGNHFDFVASNPELPRFLINEISGNPERLAQVDEFIRQNGVRMVDRLQKEIDEAASKGVCRQADARMLVMDILSLNAFPFMAAPLVNRLCGGIMENSEVFIAQRRAENIESIMRRLKL